MKISNSINNKLAFKASFSDDYYTNHVRSKALKVAPVELYALHKIIKETDTKDTFSLYKENCLIHPYGDYQLKNNTTQHTITDMSLIGLLAHAISIAETPGREAKKTLFNTDKDFRGILSQTYDEVENATGEKRTDLKNKRDMVSKKISNLEEELASLKEEKTQIQDNLDDVKKDYVAEHIFK